MTELTNTTNAPETIWINSGLSFATATEAGSFLCAQGFAACPGGFEKRDELDGGRIFASYVLTKGKCFIRFCEADQPAREPEFSQDEIWHVMRQWGCDEAAAIQHLNELERQFQEDAR